MQTKVDAITDTDQNTAQVERGEGIRGALFTSPTVVKPMTSRTKGRASLNSDTCEDDFTDVMRGQWERLSSAETKTQSFVAITHFI